MKKLLSTIAIVVAIATPALAQSWDPDVGSGNVAPPPAGETLSGASIYQKAGRPAPVDRAEVQRDNTADPNSAPFAAPTGGRPAPVDPAEVRRDNTADPG